MDGYIMCCESTIALMDCLQTQTYMNKPTKGKALTYVIGHTWNRMDDLSEML